MSIEFKDGAVCFADGGQWFYEESDTLVNNKGGFMCAADLVVFKDFQLNTIKQGDYIEALELDKHKHDDAVEVFGLFGFEWGKDAVDSYNDVIRMGSLTICHDGIFATEVTPKWCARKITFNQLIAIGELKRLELERSRSRGGILPNHFLPKPGEYAVSDKELEKSAPKITPDLTPDLGAVSSNKYERDITDRQGNSAVVDVYDVLKAFNVACPATQHALKKLLCSGLRGHKDLQTDLLEAKESITRAIELNG